MQRLATHSKALLHSSLYTPLDLSGWKVLITGASSGIGREIALRFAELNTQCVLVSRRLELLEKLKNEIKSLFPQAPEPEIAQLDVSNLEELKNFPQKLKNRDIDILVNNAGLALGTDPVDKNDLDDAQKVINTNIMAVIAMTRLFLPGMKERNRGHLINISSVAAHEAYETGSIYNASKFAVDGFTKAARMDLVATPIRVTSISPGLVKTAFSEVRFKGDKQKAENVYKDIVVMTPKDIADQVVYAATRPAHVQVADIVSYATNQAHARYSIARVGDLLGAEKKAQ